MANRFVRPTWIAWLLSIGAFATTFGLGTWQVERLHWKEGLLAQIEFAKQHAPLTLKDLPKDEAGWKEKDFWPVKLSGTWRHDIEYDLVPRYFHSKLGYAIIEPLQLADGRVALIDRGWIPSEKKDVSTRPHTVAVGHGTVLGLIRVGKERNYFMPKDQPERNLWFGRDVAAMADYYHLKNVLPVTIDAIGTQDANKLPVPSDGTIRLRNEHLSYIITWYAVALGVLVIFILYHRKPR